MPRQRFFNLAPKARARLLSVAATHFAKHGLEGASLNEILAETGISKGAYYYYFDDKDDLLATVLESAVDAVLSNLPLPDFGALTSEEFWPAVEGSVATWASAFDTSSDLFQVAAQLNEVQRKSPRFAPMLAKAQTLYRTLIEHGQRVGCIRTDLPIEVLVRILEANDAALDAAFLSEHRAVTHESVDAHVKLVFDTFKRLLIVDPDAGARPAKKARRRRA